MRRSLATSHTITIGECVFVVAVVANIEVNQWDGTATEVAAAAGRPFTFENVCSRFFVRASNEPAKRVCVCGAQKNENKINCLYLFVSESERQWEKWDYYYIFLWRSLLLNTVAFTNCTQWITRRKHDVCECEWRACVLSWRKNTCWSRHKSSHRAYVEIQK